MNKFLHRHFRLLSATALLLSGTAYAGDTFAGNGNSSFGGAIGNGSLVVTDDGTTVTFELTRGTGALNDSLVIYIDSKEGGFASTEKFDDKEDGGRITISGFDGSDRSILKFTGEFKADYAISIGAGYAVLFALSETGPHNWIETGTLTPKDDPNAAKFSCSFKRAGLNPGAEPIKISTSYINPKDAYRSNEAVGNELKGTPADDNKNFGYSTVEATSVTVKAAK